MKYTEQEQILISSMLYALLNDKDVNEWEHDFLLSMAERKQTTFSDKQAEKIKTIINKCNTYEFQNFLKLIVDNK